MSHYTRDLNSPCACALRDDAAWFLANPSRSKMVRLPWACEFTLLDEEQSQTVSQVVAVWATLSVNDALAARGQGLVPFQIRRCSFLFMGDADWHRIDSDGAVDQFMAFIDDGGSKSGKHEQALMTLVFLWFAFLSSHGGIDTYWIVCALLFDIGHRLLRDT